MEHNSALQTGPAMAQVAAIEAVEAVGRQPGRLP
jgi:hypothetical protein